MFGRRWQSPVLFCHFWEIKHHNQTGNTTAKFHISLQRERIASQFLHWIFVGKNSQFFALDRKKLSKSSFWGADDTVILSIFSGWVQKIVYFTLKVSKQKLTNYPSYLWWYVKLGGGLTDLALTCHYPTVTKRAKLVKMAKKCHLTLFLPYRNGHCGGYTLNLRCYKKCSKTLYYGLP